jgi:sterol desaturase/sphingolipid hydroxylase (fatty acid hydroxylase superfamily)
MTEQLFQDILQLLTGGWTGFVFYWLLFIAVATLEVARPSRRERGNYGDRITVNFGLGLLVASVQMLPAFSGYDAALLGKQLGLGLLPHLQPPFWLACLIGFLLLDLAGYIFHRASHRIPLLWRLHRVHHTDMAVDASTTFRSHPLATIIFIAFDSALILLLGIEPTAILIYAFSKMVTIWLSHGDIKASPKLSGVFSTVIVTPAFHHIHHRSDVAFTDSNYGEVLTIWDRLFRTRSQPDGKCARYGLGDGYDGEAASLWSQLKLPFKA